MGQKLRVISVANAGLLFRYGDTSLLIDGLYGDEPHPFSNPPAKTRDKLMQGLPPFESVDFILATHMHPDHASANLIQRYLEGHAVRGLFLPAAVHYPEKALEQYIKEHRIPCLSLTSRKGRMTCRLTDRITLKIIPTLHSGREFKDVLHYCYILRFDEEEFLVAGDVDYTTETFEGAGEGSFRCIFLNPMFFHSLHDPVHYHGHLKYEDLCVCHMPYKADDRLGFRHMVEKDISRWPKEENIPFVMDRSLMEIAF